ncbi:hypothetical protein HK405_001721 [Cladochytrium tenue]|nr:hypothetical protein HK405_001721 [Cladochytrium tenue]
MVAPIGNSNGTGALHIDTHNGDEDLFGVAAALDQVPDPYVLEPQRPRSAAAMAVLTSVGGHNPFDDADDDDDDAGASDHNDGLVVDDHNDSYASKAIVTAQNASPTSQTSPSPAASQAPQSPPAVTSPLQAAQAGTPAGRGGGGGWLGANASPDDGEDGMVLPAGFEIPETHRLSSTVDLSAAEPADIVELALATPVAAASTAEVVASEDDGERAAAMASTDPPVRSETTPKIDAEHWLRVLGWIDKERDLRALASACFAMRSSLLDPGVVAAWLMRKSTTYLAIYNAFRRYPTLLSVPVIQHLRSLGAHLPRYLCVMAWEEDTDDEVTDGKRPSKEVTSYLVSTGHAVYGGLLGFDADGAAEAATSTDRGFHSPGVINAKAKLYEETLGWVFSTGRASADNPDGGALLSDLEGFQKLLQLFRSAQSVPGIDSGGAPVNPAALQKLTGMLVSTPKVLVKDRAAVAASLRELANVYRFSPGLAGDDEATLGMDWLPLDLFEVDVELAWFLVRHCGAAVPAILKQTDNVTHKTLLGYRIHINLNHPTLPPTPENEQFPFTSVVKLARQGRISLTKDAMVKLLRDHANLTTVSRLKRLGVPTTVLHDIGRQLLTECFEGPALEQALSSGYVAKPLQKADTIIAALALPLDLVAASFMADPVEWGEFSARRGSATAVAEEDAPARIVHPHDIEVGYLTRQARASDGALPWVTWQWALKKFGAAHPVCGACLHDLCLRPLPQSAAGRRTAAAALTPFLAKESDAAVRALLAAGVRAPFCTAAAAARRALDEVETATASGEAAQAMRVQAAKLGGAMGREARRVAEAAAAAGARAVSRRYVYVLASVENALLGSEAAKQDDEAAAAIAVAAATVAAIKQSGGDGSAPPSPPPLYPATLRPQHRSLWLLALRELVVDSRRWKELTASNLSPNACRRFYVAASNMVRGLEQFGAPATALAVLRANKKPGVRALRSLSSSEIDETMLFGRWVAELEAEDAASQPDRKRT